MKPMQLKKDQGKEMEPSTGKVTPRQARPERYTFGELYDNTMAIRLPQAVKDIIYWREPIISLVHFLLGVVLLAMLAKYTALKVCAMLGLVFLGQAMLYSNVRQFVRFRPYERLLQMEMTVSPERALIITRGVVHSVNRSVATVQYLLFGSNLGVSIMIGLFVMELRTVANTFDLIRTLTYLHLGIFLLPRLLEEFIGFTQTEWFLSRRPQIWGLALLGKICKLFEVTRDPNPNAKINQDNSELEEAFFDFPSEGANFDVFN